MSLKKLKEYAGSINIAHDLSKEQLDEIQRKVMLGFTEDLNSMQEWLSDVGKIEELTSLKSVKKSTPLPNSSNVKIPIITKACYEFASRTYPAIFKDKQLVKYATIGYDDSTGQKKAQGQKCVDYMNYQLLFQSKTWEQEHDRLLFLLAMIGFIVKKSFFDPVKGRIHTCMVDYKKFIVNADSQSLLDAPRISEVINLKLNDIVARKNKKVDGKSVFLEEPAQNLYDLHKLDDLNKNIEFIEQHIDIDLDDDGIAEPYIVTALRSDGQVFRVQPRFEENGIIHEGGDIICIEPFNVYTDYHFLTNPFGKFQSVGFGILLLHVNEAINTITNQLIDAGQLANLKIGFKDARAKFVGSGNTYHSPGEFKDVACLPGVALKDAIVPFQYSEPSNVLYQLLGFLIAHAKDLSSSTEIMTGSQNSQNAKTGATLALLQQGKALHDSIQKRHYRSLSLEFQQLFKLNGLFLDKEKLTYASYAGGGVAVSGDDFDANKIHIIPVADPNLASDTERLAHAAFVQSLTGMAGIDPIKQTMFILEQTNIPGIERILADPNAQQPPNPEILKLQASIEESAQKLNIEGRRLDQGDQELQIKSDVSKADQALKRAQAIALIAQAESQNAKVNIEKYKADLGALDSLATREHDLNLATHEAGMRTQEQQSEKELLQQELESEPVEVVDGTGQANSA